MLRHLRTVAQGGDGVLFTAGDNLRVTVYPGVIADPDIVLIVALQPRLVEDFRPMLNKRVFDKGIAVNLRLVNDSRCADRRPLINPQDFIIVCGQAPGGDNMTVGENARIVGQVTISANLRMRNGDVVTYSRGVANVYAIQSDIIADNRPQADNTLAG